MTALHVMLACIVGGIAGGALGIWFTVRYERQLYRAWRRRRA